MEWKTHETAGFAGLRGGGGGEKTAKISAVRFRKNSTEFPFQNLWLVISLFLYMSLNTGSKIELPNVFIAVSSLFSYFLSTPEM